MIKCITPNPALPFSNLNMLNHNDLPSRSQRTQTRNMTGVYLGHETNSQSKKSSIPPLARGRGMTSRQKTPVERRRYQRVESLRIREEHRGFNPMPIKKAKPRTATPWKADERVNSPRSKGSQSPSDVGGLPKKTGRNYVAVANSGFTHLESLGSPHGWNRSEFEKSQSSPTVEDIRTEEGLAGLEDCYRKIYKQGTMPTMQSLLPHRKVGGVTKTKHTNHTPLTIRSFRNPQNPHPVVQYSDPQAHPQTLPSTTSRPGVPAPYYYSSKNLPKTAGESGSRVRLQRVQGSGKARDKILAAPGVGSLTRSANRKRGTPVDPPPGIEGTTPPTNPNQTKIMDDPGDYYRELRVPSGTPASSATNIARLANSQRTAIFPNESSEMPDHDTRIQRSRSSPASDSSVDTDIITGANLNNSNTLNMDSLTLTEKNPAEDDPSMHHNDGGQTMSETGEEVIENSVTNIIISVQDDEGHSKTLNIQEEDFTQGTVVAKTRPLLRFSRIAEAVLEASKRKQMEFQTLLEEHAELVSQIEVMEQKNKTSA